MTDYTELVKALRHCEFAWSARTCDYCEYSKTDCQLLLSDAADAIEALQAEQKKTVTQIFGEEQMAWEGRCKDLMYQIADLQEQLSKRGEIVRCGECKYHLPETERTNPYCNRFHCMKPDDWFCADGERKVQDERCT